MQKWSGLVNEKCGACNGETQLTWEPEDKAAVQNFIGFWVCDFAQQGGPWWRKATFESSHTP